MKQQKIVDDKIAAEAFNALYRAAVKSKDKNALLGIDIITAYMKRIEALIAVDPELRSKFYGNS